MWVTCIPNQMVVSCPLAMMEKAKVEVYLLALNVLHQVVKPDNLLRFSDMAAVAPDLNCCCWKRSLLMIHSAYSFHLIFLLCLFL